jgi:hypothetical protein
MRLTGHDSAHTFQRINLQRQSLRSSSLQATIQTASHLANMKFTSSVLFLTSSTILGSASVIPVQLERRATGDRSDPIWINIDCKNGEALCNADCYAILCLAVPNPTQYDAKNSDTKRDASGYRNGMLRTTEYTRQQKGIQIPQHILQQVGDSPEETCMANSMQGGDGEILIAANKDENRCQLP